MAASSSDSDQIDFGSLNQLVGYRLRRAQMHFFNKFSEACSDMGLSPGLFAVLEIVSRNPGLTQTAVAQALGNDRSAMVSAVDRLEKMDLLERRASERDRRSYALYMTSNGERFYKKMIAKVNAHEEDLLAALSKEERRWLLDMLARLAG